MKNFIVIIAIAVVLSLAIGYIIKQKKKGVKCIGCPNSKNCGGCNKN